MCPVTNRYPPWYDLRCCYDIKQQTNNTLLPIHTHTHTFGQPQTLGVSVTGPNVVSWEAIGAEQADKLGTQGCVWAYIKHSPLPRVKVKLCYASCNFHFKCSISKKYHYAGLEPTRWVLSVFLLDLKSNALRLIVTRAQNRSYEWFVCLLFCVLATSKVISRRDYIWEEYMKERERNAMGVEERRAGTIETYKK